MRGCIDIMLQKKKIEKRKLLTNTAAGVPSGRNLGTSHRISLLVIFFRMLLPDSKILSNSRIDTIKSASQICKPPQAALHSPPTHPHTNKRKKAEIPKQMYARKGEKGCAQGNPSAQGTRNQPCYVEEDILFLAGQCEMWKTKLLFSVFGLPTGSV